MKTSDRIISLLWAICLITTITMAGVSINNRITEQNAILNDIEYQLSSLHQIKTVSAAEVDEKVEGLGSMIKVLEDMTGRTQKQIEKRGR